MKHLENKDVDSKIYHLHGWTNTISTEQLSCILANTLSAADFCILNFNEHHFPVEGYTAYWLLAESHLALHTFPNKGWSYIELSSCNEKKTLIFQELLNQTELNVQWQEPMSIRTPKTEVL